MANTTFKIISLSSIVVLLGACVGGIVGGKPPKENHYDIPYVAPKLILRKPLLNGTLGIARPETDGVHDNVQMLFTYSDRPHSVTKHNYHLWQDAPSSLVQKRLRRYFMDAQIAKKVVYFDPGENVDYILKSRIHRLERFVNKDKNKKYDEVVFGIEIRIIRASNYSTVFPEVYFEKRIRTLRSSSSEETVHASVEAFGIAFKQSMDSYVQTNLPKKKSRTAKKNRVKSEKLTHSK